MHPCDQMQRYPTEEHIYISYRQNFNGHSIGSDSSNRVKQVT